MRAKPATVAAMAIAAAVAGAPGVRAEEPDAASFFAAFAQACIPKRLSYDGTISHATSLGWRETGESDHPELEELTATADHEAAIMTRDDPDTQLQRAQFVRDVAGRPHYLIVTRVETPDIITLIGCYLYDFEATAPINPDTITSLLGRPLGRTVEDEGFLQHTWGPNYEARPRTLDTNLSFIAEGSPHVATTGFSGLVLKFETSEPE